VGECAAASAPVPINYQANRAGERRAVSGIEHELERGLGVRLGGAFAS